MTVLKKKQLGGKRVLVINPTATGGLSHYGNDLSNALCSYFESVKLLTLEPFEVPSHFCQYKVITIAKKRINYKAKRLICTLMAFPIALKLSHQYFFDLVLINGYWPFLSWLYSVFRPSTVPVYCIQHEVEPRQADKSIGYFQRDFYRRMTGMVVHKGTDAYDLLRQKYGITKDIILIDHAIYDSDIFGRDALKTHSKEVTILFFGSIRPDKGVNILVKAYPGNRHCGGFDLVIAGKAVAQLRGRIDSLIRSQNISGIKWIDEYIPLIDVANYFANAAFVVLPFLFGRQSGTLRLAIFFGKPVIVSDTGELSSIVKKYELGLVIPPNDIEALKTAMIRLSNDLELRKKLSENVIALRDSDKLSWNTVVSNMLRQMRCTGKN